MNKKSDIMEKDLMAKYAPARKRPSGCSITFLGTCGGRFAVINQVRASGGWILEMDGEMLHIDPGPGALVRAKQFGVNLWNITGLLISHAHPDHYGDAEMVLEAMTKGVKEKRGILVSNKNVISGSRDFHQVFSNYHLNAVKKYQILKAGDRTNMGNVSVTATKTQHDEPECIGFVFEGSKKIGFTSDGEYFAGQADYYKNCDCLLINCLVRLGQSWPGHMNTESAAKLVSEAKPGFAVIKDFGGYMLESGPEKDAAWIEKQTGIKTIAAQDGMKLDI